MTELSQNSSELPPQVPEPQKSAPPESPQPKRKARRSPSLLLSAILLVGLIGGSLIGYSLSYVAFNGKIDTLQTQVQNLQSNQTYVSYPNATYNLGNNVSLATLYKLVQQSVVVITDLVPEYNFFGQLAGYAQQQGSGFVVTVNGEQVIVTNNHVVEGGINATVTFVNGDSYLAKEIGSDPQSDIAVVTVNAVGSDLQPLLLVSSLTLSVGDPVVAVGSPYGLSGTLTTGVISALGRTITESSETSSATGPTIPDVIQTSTAINPGNSGGPLVNYEGEVVGITTAAVSSSQGLGFAIPSETIIRELGTLVSKGSYDQHPSIEATGTDMNLQIAQAMGTSTSYGWLVESVSSQNGLKGGTIRATVLGSQITLGGDIIIAINGGRITNGDGLLSYLEQHTQPGQTVNFTVVRNGQTQTVAVTIGKLSS